MSGLEDKSALVVGSGGLGGSALLTLGAAGVGRLALIDDDVVETSNLNRQPLFGEADLGTRKVEAAARRLRMLFPALEVEAHDRRFDAGNALDLVRSCQVALDGSDNFPTKFLANDAALAAGRPLVHGGLLRYTAQILTVVPGETGCLRCLFEEPPPPGSVPTCAEAGVLGALAGLAGALMAGEALRLLSGAPGSYAGRLMVLEARPARTRTVVVRRRAGCPACEGKQPLGSGAAAPSARTPGAPA